MTQCVDEILRLGLYGYICFLFYSLLHIEMTWLGFLNKKSVRFPVPLIIFFLLDFYFPLLSQ